VKYNDKVGERKDSKNISNDTEPNKDNFIRTGEKRKKKIHRTKLMS
jgi:hypothetical protein